MHTTSDGQCNAEQHNQVHAHTASQAAILTACTTASDRLPMIPLVSFTGAIHCNAMRRTSSSIQFRSTWLDQHTTSSSKQCNKQRTGNTATKLHQSALEQECKFGRPSHTGGSMASYLLICYISYIATASTTAVALTAKTKNQAHVPRQSKRGSLHCQCTDLLCLLLATQECRRASQTKPAPRLVQQQLPDTQQAACLLPLPSMHLIALLHTSHFISKLACPVHSSAFFPTLWVQCALSVAKLAAQNLHSRETSAMLAASRPFPPTQLATA